MQITGKVAIVTGGGRGIGRAIATRFAQSGARVVIAEFEQATGQATVDAVHAQNGDSHFHQTDVGDRASVDALVQATLDRYGSIDILVNNAGLTGENGHFLEVTQETWNRVLRVNQNGIFHCSQAVAQVMAQARSGNIISISSVNGSVPQARCVAYAAAKAAVESITKSMAIDLAPYGIRANAIAPGPIQTNVPEDQPPRPNDKTLLYRNGLTREIAAAALFLASEESSYITGQTLVVDGGKLLNAYAIYGVERPQP
jgi:3-oxoacyl-[acyl-carrier protein] reductase